MELVIASSPFDAGISCWDLHTGTENLRYRSCASSTHGLTSVAGNFLASSQFKDSSSSSTGSILYWSWNKPQVEVKSFPAEVIGPIVANFKGTYLFGGGLSGSVYMWEVASGRMLKKWQAHYRSVTCFAFSNDESFLISGSEDGGIRVWCLVMLFDDMASFEKKHLYQYSFYEHSLRVTDIVTGYGLCNSIAISSSEDYTCKIWSLSKGKLLRSVTFPSIINAVAMDPGEHVFYAAGRDGKIYISALNTVCTPSSNSGMHIIGSFSDESKSINCLVLSSDGITLVSGSEDGTIRAWDTRNQHVIRVLKHAKGPINNVLIVRQPFLSYSQGPSNWQISSCKKCVNLSLAPQLERHFSSLDGNIEHKVILLHQSTSEDMLYNKYRTYDVMKNQIEELQQQGSSGATEMELERLKQESKRSAQMSQHWKKLYQDLHKFCVDELLDSREQLPAKKKKKKNHQRPVQKLNKHLENNY